MINSLFEVKTRDRPACVTEQILWGKKSISGRSKAQHVWGRWVSRCECKCVCVCVCSRGICSQFIGNTEEQARGVLSQVSGCVHKEMETQTSL